MKINLPHIDLYALLDGDETEFNIIYGFYCPIISRYIRGKCPVYEDVEELVQEVFVQLFLSRQKINHVEDIYPLLFTIAKRLTISYFRKMISLQNTHLTAEKYWSYTDNSTEEWIEIDELNKILDTIIANLPPQQQRVYLLSHQDSLTNEDIALTLNLSKNTVKNHLRLATKSVRLSISRLYQILF